MPMQPVSLVDHLSACHSSLISVVAFKFHRENVNV